MNSFEARRQAKIERYRELAANAKKRSEFRFTRAETVSSFIPFGQPILVGHHSEGRHRRDLDRIHNNMHKGFEEREKAQYWAGRAAAVANNTAIFKQDPEAVIKLNEKLEKAMEFQEKMKAANKALRAGDDEALKELGFKDAQIASLKEPDFAGRVGFPSYAITNNGAEIRRIKQRIEAVRREQARPETEEVVGSVVVRENADFGSIEITFPGKPAQAIIDELKLNGFKWARSVGCWYTKQRTDYRLKIAKEIAAKAEGQAA